MLRRCFIISGIAAALLPTLFFAALAPFTEGLNPSMAKRKVHDLLFEDLNAAWTEDYTAATVPSFHGWGEKRHIPQIFFRRFPRRLALWLQFQSSETVHEVFEEAFSSLVPPETGDRYKPDFLLWRLACRAMSGDFLLRALDISLKQGRLEGVEAFLRLPSLEYFLGPYRNSEWHGKHDRNVINLLEYEKTFAPRKYADIPWFMKWSGKDVLERLCDEPDGEVKVAIGAKMNEALGEWERCCVWPWLPIAYLTRCPDQASGEHLEKYLERTVKGEACPYMLNAAALFLHRAEQERIGRLLLALRPAGMEAIGRDLDERNTMGDEAFLYWFMVGSAPALCNQEGRRAVDEVAGETSPRPMSFDVIAEMWTGARGYLAQVNKASIIERWDFYTLMQGLSAGRSTRYWEAIELTPFKQGHCFMDL